MVRISYFTAAAVNIVTLVGGVTAAPTDKRASTSFWYANLNHTGDGVRGFAPDLDGDLSYSVYKEVTPGGGGAAIQAAINDGTGGAKRHGQWLASQPRVVYLPPGEYIIDKTIKMNTDTVLMGDATSPPVLKAASGFSDHILLSGQDPTTEEKGELSFAVSLKNLILDTTNIPAGTAFTALWWGVAQGAQLQNVKIHMPQSVNGNGHTGIKLGRGSTLGLGDVRIENGQNGIWHDGHQQALYKSIYFYQNTVGILISGGSTISIVDPTFHSVGTAVLNTGGYPWIGIIDAKSINSGITFKTTSYPSFLIENLKKDTTSAIVQGPETFTLAWQPYLSRFSYGNTVGRTPIYGPDSTAAPDRPAALAPGGHYPSMPAPNYADLPASAFLNVKDPAQNGGRTVHGDGAHDEAAALNAILALAAQQARIAYFPFGKYRVDATLLVPPGSRLVGEAWATVTGSGAFFRDARNPQPVVMVGRPGDVGVAQIQDMRFTVSEVLPGAVLVQFHMAGGRPGQVGLWNSLVTVGGTRGAQGLAGGCRDAAEQCRAAFLGMHFAPTSSVYVENVWNWVADHVTEEFDGGSNIAAGRGVLVEATKGTWLHALGSEHWWLYQLNVRKADNVLVTMLQSETNYDQGDNNKQLPPAPWTADGAWGDPDFGWCGADEARCRMGPSNYINGGSNIYTYASASWAFFSGPGYQPCAGTYQCQKYMHWIEETPSNLQVFGLCSKDAHTILRLADGTEITTSKDFTGSWPGGGGDIGRYTP
ncbi:glycoside hydrolase family 55 protein [Lasiosphaeria hispida]|uniref:Glycoside hydrolase family 55 protein n=1 Tax=Lasiosphaeria hispida TaxID=260671 RepID=A0AAJ0HAI6_9PEZI|nr:glycoside hydrolase family 55 protein [Lasiosphaeria hispida]